MKQRIRSRVKGLYRLKRILFRRSKAQRPSKKKKAARRAVLLIQRVCPTAKDSRI
jgi:hypothetical protein